MCKKIILVSGYAAGGKTFFSKKLAGKLNLPVFNKDDMKAVLGNYVDIPNRSVSKTLSNATVGLMIHVAEIFMKVGSPLILESNFRKDEEEILRQVIAGYGYETLSFVLVGDLKVLHKRFILRDSSPERDKANRVGGLLDRFEDFEKEVSPLGDFSLGDQIVKIDTTEFDKVDYDGYIRMAEEFMAAYHS